MFVSSMKGGVIVEEIFLFVWVTLLAPCLRMLFKHWLDKKNK